MHKESVEEIRNRQKQAREIVEGVSLEWAVERAGDGLALRYTVRHGGETALYVLDRVIAFAPKEGFEEAPDRIIALAKEDDPETLALSRGWVRPPWSDVMIEVMPGGRRLEPGGTLEGNARLPLPLAAWHPNEGTALLKSPPSRLELRVGLLPTFCELRDLALADGSTVPVVHGADAFLYQQWLASEPRPIPG